MTSILTACGGGGGGGGDSVTQTAPVAAAGVLQTDEDTPNSGTLSASDVDGDSLTYSIVSNAGKGTATVTDPATGAYTYTPDLGTNGEDSFTFKANDGTADSNVATVAVTVIAANTPPVATGNCSTTPQEQTLAATFDATDLETPTLLMYSLNADGSGGLGPITTTNGGTVTITSDGAFTYEPPPSLLATSGGRGTDSFDYQVSDPDGGSDSATETVIVDQKIMPLGDSITQGVIIPVPAERVGYRLPLSDLLTTAAFTFDFVGSLIDDGDGVPDFDFEHEGHPALSAFDIAFGASGLGYPTDGVHVWLDDNPADIILLHAGTNELDPVTGPSDVAAILQEIDNWEASPVGNPVTVLLALIIDQDPIEPDVTTFNTNLQTMANGRIIAGDDIIVVNQHDALSYPADLSDRLHPDDTGYGNMANTWFSDLAPLLDTCP